MVGWLSVTEGARAPTAMAATEAIVFITVLGKIIGESPAGPRCRYPPRTPRSSGSRRAPSRRRWRARARIRPRILHRQAARRHGEAADPREPAGLGRIDEGGQPRVVDLGREPARARLRDKAAKRSDPRSAEGERLRHRRCPPEVSALTVPIPVMTTRRRRGGVGSDEPVMSVGAMSGPPLSGRTG